MLSDSTNPKREIGLVYAVFIGLGSALGGSIFVLIAPGVQLAGEFLPYSFLIGGLLALLVTYLYSEVSSSMPGSGSELLFLFDSFGRGPFAFILSWLVILGDIGYFALHTLAFALYAAVFIPLSPTIIALGLVVFVAWINLKSIRNTGTFETIATGVLILLLMAFLFLVFGQYIPLEPSLQNGGPTMSFLGVFSAMSLIYTALMGYEGIASIAGEISSPEKNLRRAFIITVIISTAIFFMLTLVAVRTVPLAELAESDVALFTVAEKAGDGVLKIIIVIAALLATVTSAITALLIASRKTYALAGEGFFESKFHNLNKRGVPKYAVIFGAIAVVGLIASGSAAHIAYVGNVAYFVLFIALSVALIKMRAQRPFLLRPVRIPFYPWLPIFIIVVTASAMVFVDKMAYLVAIAWCALGFIVYLASRIRKERFLWILAGAIFYALVIFAFVFSILPLLLIYLP